jgi:hypothetical protein
LANQAQHFGDVFSCARLNGGRLNAQPGNVAMHGRDHLVSQRSNCDAPLQRSFNDLVVDVRDVANIAAAFQPTLSHIEGHHHSGMTNVAKVINGHPADVHPDMARLQGGKRFKGTRQRVVYVQAHEY